MVTLVMALAVAEAIEEMIPDAKIKWPNDIVIDGKKVCGILTEMALDAKTGLVDYAVVGIGINCRQQPQDFPEEIRGFAGSLAMALDRDVSTAAMAAAMIDALHTMSRDLFSPIAILMDRYRADCITVGRDISLLRGDSLRHGHAIGVDDLGALLVRFPDGHVEAVNSGEVSVRGMYGYL